MAGFVSGATPSPTEAHGKRFKHESLAMLCYFMLGCGFLAGWNAFLTATDFFNSVFPDRSIDRVFTIVYLPLTFTLVGLVARFPRILWTGKIRIWTAYSLFTLANAAVPVIDALLIHGQPAGHSEAAYGLALAAVALVAVGDGLSQGTVLGDAALLPDKYTRAVVMGMSASGVIIGILRLITKGALVGATSGLRISTQIYFACAAAITATCLILYQAVMPRLDVVCYYRGRLAAEQAQADLAARTYSEEHNCQPASPRNSFIHISVTGQRLRGVQQDSSLLLPGISSGRRSMSGGGEEEEDCEAARQQQGHYQVQQGSPGKDTTVPVDTAAAAAAAAAAALGTAGSSPADAASRLQVLPGHTSTAGASNTLSPPPPPAAAAAAPQIPPGTTSGTTAAAAAAAAAAPGKPKSFNVGGLDLEAMQHTFDDDTAAQTTAEVGMLTWTNILRLNWRLCLAVFFVYAVTLSIFPGFLAENVHSSALKDWYAVLLIFTFNIFDFLGRCTPSFGWCPSHTTLLCLALARLLLEPLYAVLSRQGAGEPVFFVLTFILGASNGYLTALIFMAAPRGLSPSAAELAGMINVFCELAGLNVGAFLGWLWTM